ncbi:hypothetical protein Thpro_020183 [Acidihalobacter prosperus]|uniref:PilZ domain-containing protein n=1 Tax=Acidihalobacter prosperus TaxID=160660 RepID=A0A1A6C7D1_9GAMM|nr:hypothetical protein Thpro_020183 [Acidihalobacter prosperus]
MHRVRFIARAVLKTQGHTVEVQMLDISLKGALVDLPADVTTPSLESRVVLDLVLGGDIELVATGRVVRVAPPHRLGLLWESMDVDTATHLHRLLVLNLGGEEAFEADLDAMLAAQADD